MNFKILTYELGPPKGMEGFEVKAKESLVSWVRFMSTSKHTILSGVRSHIGDNRCELEVLWWFSTLISLTNLR